MATSALEKIRAIEEEAANKIAALKSEAVSEVVKRISEAKAVLQELEAEYAALTGKNFKGEPAAGKRKRLSADEKTALIETVKAVLKGNKNGSKMSEIISGAGESASAVREALSKVKGVTTTGNKASTLYFLK